jgi:hypothetical protein
MASTQTWTEYNSVAGTATETGARGESNWKNIDDSTTAYSASPVPAGNNSFGKYQALKFAGTWNSLSVLTYKIDNNAPATGVSIVGAVVSAWTAPAVTATGDSALSTTGLAVSFGTSAYTPATNPTTGPFSVAGGSSTTATGTMYANALRSQVQTTTGAAPGDIASRTITAAWTES